MITIISAKERLAERRGAKALLVGFPGIGKTSQLRCLDPVRTLIIDIEAGDLSVQDWPVSTIRIDDWPSLRDLAVRIGGPDPSFPATSCFSQAHYQAAGGALDNLDGFDTLFLDSVTAASRLCYRWCEQQPEAFSERTGARDVRATYGLLAREMITLLQHLQHARGKNVVFVVILEKALDDFNRTLLQIQMEGAKTSRELPGIVDEIITLDFIDFGDGKPADIPQISRLGERQLGWIVTAALFGWIAVRAEQASNEGRDAETLIRMTGQKPDPWDIGAMEAVLPELAKFDLDWSKPLASWSKSEMVRFIIKAIDLTGEARHARDLCTGAIIRPSAKKDPSDDCPF